MVQKISAAPARGRTPSNASGPSQGTKASRRTPSATLKMPQARRTPTARRGRRYSHDLTRTLWSTDREEGGPSFNAYIGMPPVTRSATGWDRNRTPNWNEEASPQAGRGLVDAATG